MKNLTELLKDIPLEEMTGGLNMSFSEENKTITNVQNDKVKIKNKAPAAVAIAACAALAVFGTTKYLGKNTPKPITTNETTLTTDEEDTTDIEDIFDEESTDAEDIESTDAEDSDSTTEERDEEIFEFNKKIARHWYDEHGTDYDLAKDSIVVMDRKYGEKVEGYEDVDIWVADVKVSYPYLEADIVFNSKNGGEISYNDFTFLFGYNDELAWGDSVSYTDIDENTWFGTYRVILSEFNGLEALNESDTYTLYITNDDKVLIPNLYLSYEYEPTANYGVFKADFSIGKDIEILPNEENEHHISVNTEGKWNMLDFKTGDSFIDIEYTINSIDWSNDKFIFNMKLKTEPDGFFTPNFGRQLATHFYDEEAVADVSSNNLITDFSDETFTYDYDYDPDRDYNFVKLEYADGSIKNLNFNYDDVNSKRCRDDSIDISFNCIEYPFDAEGVTAIHVGSVVIPVK